MKRTAISAVILAIFLSVAGCTSQRYAQYHRERPPVDTLAMMKKQDVISLTKAGVNDSLIMTMLATSHSWFQLKTQDVLDLKNAGVSDKVINAMIVSNEPPTEGDRYVQDGYYYYPPYYWVLSILVLSVILLWILLLPAVLQFPWRVLRRLRIPRRLGRRRFPPSLKGEDWFLKAVPPDFFPLHREKKSGALPALLLRGKTETIS